MRVAPKYEYTAISDESATSLADAIQNREDKGWELVTVTSVGAVIEGQAVPNHWAFMRRPR